MTLRTRDLVDLVDPLLAFHLNAGADFVIATDHRSTDGTRDVLREYEREGVLLLIVEDGAEVKGREWRTRMARLAATDYGADWVFSADGDEFWWPRGESYAEVLGAVPDPYGVVRCPWRSFLPRPGDGPFYERMDIRFATQAPVNEPASPYRPNSKIIHRARPDVTVERGNHALEWPLAVPELPGWHPIEILHFPIRDESQYRQKSQAWLSGLLEQPGSQARSPHRVRAAQLSDRGLLGDLVRGFSVDDEVLARGLAEGSLVVDTRLRDVLRPFLDGGVDRAALAGPGRPAVRLPSADTSADALYASDLAVCEEAMSVRTGRLLDSLERRLVRLEAAGPRPRQPALGSPPVQVVVALTGFADAELLELQVAFHLAAGAAVVAVPVDVPEGATQVLEHFERDGRVRRVASADEMAAEWILSAGPGTFWWPRGGGLEEVLGAVPSRYGALRSVERRFVRAGGGDTLSDRMHVRETAAFDGPTATRRSAPGLIPLRGWRPCEVLVIPAAGSPDAGERPTVEDRRLLDARECLAGGSAESVEAADGRLRFRRPGIVDEASYALEVAELEPVDAASLAAPVAALARRITTLEDGGGRGLVSRITRRLRR